MRLNRLCFALFIIVLCLFCVACNKSFDDESEQETASDTIEGDFKFTPQIRDTLYFANTDFEWTFNPFYAKNENDVRVVDLTSVRLLTFDRNGSLIENAIEGMETEFNGELYNYNGVADVNILHYDKTEIVITIRDNVYFSDGELLDVDDLIFTMYVLSDPSYNGPFGFSDLPIMGMEEYKNGDALNISGITRINDNSLKIQLTQNDKYLLSKLDLFIAPLHHYGDVAKYNYENSSFGFEKGNVAFVSSKSLLGAGAFSFVTSDENSVYFTMNRSYYKGTPKIKHVVLKQIDISDMILSVCNGSSDAAEFYVDDKVAAELNNVLDEDDGFILSSYIYNKDNRQCAQLINTKAINKNSISGYYNAYYSVINDIHFVELCPGM